MNRNERLHWSFRRCEDLNFGEVDCDNDRSLADLDQSGTIHEIRSDFWKVQFDLSLEIQLILEKIQLE